MKEKIAKFKEMWKDPKKKAIIKLCLYLGFMSFLIIIINISNVISNQKNESQNNKIISNNDNYEYNGIISINSFNYNIEGIRYKEHENIKIKELKEEYEFKNDIIKTSNKYINYVNFLNLRIDVIEEKIKNIKPTKQIDYKDGNKKIEYTLSLNYLKILNNNDLDREYKIIIYKNNQINKIEIDLSNIVNLIDNKVNNFFITIEYKNIGNISNFSSN